MSTPSGRSSYSGAAHSLPPSLPPGFICAVGAALRAMRRALPYLGVQLRHGDLRYRRLAARWDQQERQFGAQLGARREQKEQKRSGARTDMRAERPLARMPSALAREQAELQAVGWAASA